MILISTPYKNFLTVRTVVTKKCGWFEESRIRIRSLNLLAEVDERWNICLLNMTKNVIENENAVSTKSFLLQPLYFLNISIVIEFLRVGLFKFIVILLSRVRRAALAGRAAPRKGWATFSTHHCIGPQIYLHAGGWPPDPLLPLRCYLIRK